VGAFLPVRPSWVLPFGILLLLAPAVAADPTVTMPSATQGVARWTFSNPANYTVSNVSLEIGRAALAEVSGSVGDFGLGEFSRALLLDNIDVTSQPGRAILQNTSRPGRATNLTFQAIPAQLDDNYLWSGGGANGNFGFSPNLFVGYWGNPEWTRAILRWPALPLPSNATLLSADLQLYMHTADTPDAMDVTVHRMTTAWTELGSSWNDYDGSNAWNASGGGGDFDPIAFDGVGGITTATGWYTWNVTPAAKDWWAGTAANHGILVRQANDDLRVSLGRKEFYSSDATNSSLRPRLVLTYTTPSSTGTLESRVLGPGTQTTWRGISWNATLPAGTAVSLHTRTGASPLIDATWSPWTPAYPSPGSAITSPTGSFAQYRATLFTPSASSPALLSVSLGYECYAPSGILVSQPFFPADLVSWGSLETNWTGLPGTNATLAYSQDDGATWVPAPPGSSLAGVPLQPISLRVTLVTNDTTRTPTVRSVSLGYALRGAGGGFLYLPVVGPFWVLLIPLLILAAWTLAMALRRGKFDATDLFLIHADGRLVLRVGGRESPLQDELAVSGMFTLVAQFVKDSFRRAGAERGDLKNFRVDDREVTVAKGDYLFLALVGEGAPPPELQGNLARFLERIERSQRATLRRWDGFRDGVGETERMLTGFLRKGYRHRPLLGGRSARR